MIVERQIEVNNLQVHILDTGAKDRAIIFIHGNSSEAGYWNDQLSDPLLNEKYRLIAFDLPGHGKSAKAGNYDIQQMSQILPGIVSALSIKEYIVAGLSYGTCLIAEAAPDLPGCKGIVIASSNLTSNDFPPELWLTPFPEIAALAAPDIDDAILQSFAKRLVHADQHVAENFVSSYKATAPGFRLAIGNLIAGRAWSDELLNLKKMDIPVCVIFGAKENVIHTGYLNNFSPIWQNKIFHIADAGHFVNAEQPAAFNKILAEYAADIFPG